MTTPTVSLHNYNPYDSNCLVYPIIGSTKKITPDENTISRLPVKVGTDPKGFPANRCKNFLVALPPIVLYPRNEAGDKRRNEMLVSSGKPPMKPGMQYNPSKLCVDATFKMGDVGDEKYKEEFARHFSIQDIARSSYALGEFIMNRLLELEAADEDKYGELLNKATKGFGLGTVAYPLYPNEKDENGVAISKATLSPMDGGVRFDAITHLNGQLRIFAPENSKFGGCDIFLQKRNGSRVKVRSYQEINKHTWIASVVCSIGLGNSTSRNKLGFVLSSMILHRKCKSEFGPPAILAVEGIENIADAFGANDSDESSDDQEVDEPMDDGDLGYLED